MKKNFKLRISTLLLIVILVVFAVLLIVNETKLFKNDVNYSFDEAVSNATRERYCTDKRRGW